MTQRKTIDTVWSKCIYDVWGNWKDGYEVNDSYRQRDVELRLKIHTHNIGTPNEFQSASISHYQLQQVFGTRATLDSSQGDDLYYPVNRQSDGYPVGELRCESNPSLSPISFYGVSK